MSKLLMNQLAATNMVYSRFSFGYFLDSMDRLGIHRLELYGCSTHFHFYDGDENPAPAMKKLLRQRGFQVVSLMPEENTYAINIAAPEANIRNKTVEQYKRSSRLPPSWNALRCCCARGARTGISRSPWGMPAGATRWKSWCATVKNTV